VRGPAGRSVTYSRCRGSASVTLRRSARDCPCDRPQKSRPARRAARCQQGGINKTRIIGTAVAPSGIRPLGRDTMAA